MSAFNDYCTVCGQLIQRDNAAGLDDNDRLYCSSHCQELDRMNIENLKLSKELAGTPASLIRSPLLQPVDGSAARPTGNYSSMYDLIDAHNAGEPEFDMDMELDMSLDSTLIGEACTIPMMTIPRSVLGKEPKPEVVCDHTAEDNYKLWLNYNLTS